MTETVQELERRIDELRVAVREAVLASEGSRAIGLRAKLREAEQAWEDALAQAARASGPWPAAAGGGAAARDANAYDGPAHEGTVPFPGGSGPLLPLREQVYEALSLLQVPAAPKLIATVHEAFFATTFPTQRVTSLRRDEERSFRTAPFARPYYICAALTADYLAPSRGLLAVSTWPMDRRVIGPLSPRVDFLEAAIRVAEAIERIPSPPPAARRLLLRFAASIPGGSDDSLGMNPQAVKAAARAELGVHKDRDTAVRKEAAARARKQLGDAEQLFGMPKSVTDRPAGAGQDGSGAGDG
jgi:hypothetical protein